MIYTNSGSETAIIYAFTVLFYNVTSNCLTVFILPSIYNVIIILGTGMRPQPTVVFFLTAPVRRGTERE